MSWNSAGNYFENHERSEYHYDCTTGIKEVEQQAFFKVYPNPATDQITIQTKVNARFIVYDYSGRTVINSFDVKNEEQLSIGDLKAGIYFLKAEGYPGVKKFIKQ